MSAILTGLRFEENQRMIRWRNSVNWQGDESMAAIRAGQGLLAGLLRCGHCGRKLHVRYWGGRGTHARYLCKGDFDDGGQYCIGFGGASVDRRLGQELLKAISLLGVEASLKAIEELSAGDVAQRVALSSKLKQLDYEARKAFEQYDAVDARNRLVAEELERRWNEKLEEVEITKQRLSSLNGNRHSLSSEEEAQIRYMGERFAELWQSDRCPSELEEDDLSNGDGRDHGAQRCGEENPAIHHSLEERWHSHSDRNRAAAPSNRDGNIYGGIRHHPSDGRSKW